MSQELGRAITGLKSLSQAKIITDFAAEKARDFGLENEFNEIKSLSDNPDKILDGLYTNLEMVIVDPDKLKKKMQEKKRILVRPIYPLLWEGTCFSLKGL